LSQGLLGFARRWTYLRCMGLVLSLLAVLSFSMIVTRVAAVMLVHTGISSEAARFQARSAFTGVGFTTSESESVMNHPVRRHIVMAVMLIGNVGFITVISTSVLTLTQFQSDGQNPVIVLSMLSGGLIVLMLIARSQWIDRRLSRLISRLLKRFTSLDVRDYASLLQLGGEYRVTDLSVEEGDWLAGRTLVQLRLRDEGVMVLGINRKDGTYVGAPRGSSVILSGDSIILYGKIGMCERLDERVHGYEGEVEHREAVAEQRRELEHQELIDSGVIEA
jgi:K+/H+ antiporter YhaU regulatory subunit KhtT